MLYEQSFMLYIRGLEVKIRGILNLTRISHTLFERIPASKRTIRPRMLSIW